MFPILFSSTRRKWSPQKLTGLFATLLPALSRERGLLFQDAGKTTPATANSHPVRVAICPYTAREWIAPSDSARPTLYDEGGGKWSLNHDGVDDYLLLTTGTVALSAYTSYLRVRPGVTSDLQFGEFRNSGAANPIVGDMVNIGGMLNVRTRNDSGTLVAVATITAFSGSYKTIGNLWDGSTIAGRVDGTAYGPSASTGTRTITRGTSCGSASTLGTTLISGRTSGRIFTTAAVSALDISRIESFLATL